MAPLILEYTHPLMQSFWSSEAEGVLFWSFVQQIQQIMEQALRQSCWRSEVFGPHISLLYSLADTGRVHPAIILGEVLGGEDRQ